MKIQNWIYAIGIATIMSACGINGKDDRSNATSPEDQSVTSIHFKPIQEKEMVLATGQKVVAFGTTEKTQLTPALLNRIDQSISGPLQVQREEVLFKEYYESEKGVPTRNFRTDEIKSSIFLLKTASENEILIATDGNIEKLRTQKQSIEVNADPMAYWLTVNVPKCPIKINGGEAYLAPQKVTCTEAQQCDVVIHSKMDFMGIERDDARKVALSLIVGCGASLDKTGKSYRKKTRETNTSKVMKITIPGILELIPIQ